MVYIHLAEGFEEIEAVTILDILRRGQVEAESVSVTGRHLVQGAHQISIRADLTFEEADYDTCAMIVLPGGMPGTTNLGNHQLLLDKIVEFHQEGKLVAAICAAPMVLGKAGILKGKRATIYPGMEDKIPEAILGPERVIVDGKVITSKGPGTAMEFALKLIEILKGEEASRKVREGLIL